MGYLGGAADPQGGVPHNGNGFFNQAGLPFGSNGRPGSGGGAYNVVTQTSKPGQYEAAKAGVHEAVDSSTLEDSSLPALMTEILAPAVGLPLPTRCPRKRHLRLTDGHTCPATFPVADP